MASGLIKQLNAKAAPQTRRILIYGDSSAGKTRLVGTAQDTAGMKDVLIVDIDGGTRTVSARGDISAAPAFNTLGVEKILWMFAEKNPEVASFGTLVLDGASELQKRDLAEIAAKAASQGGAGRERDQDLNELQDYKLNKARLLRIFRQARDLQGINLIITAWAKKTFPKIPGTKQINKDAQPTQIAPDFTDGLGDVLRGYVDDVWYLFHDQAADVRRLVTSGYSTVMAKTRGEEFAAKLGQQTKDGFVPIIDNPTFPKIWALYDEAMGVRR